MMGTNYAFVVNSIRHCVCHAGGYWANRISFCRLPSNGG